MTTGRNFDEILRVIDSLQLTAKHKVATPVNWKQGEDVVIAGSVSNDQAKEIFGTLGRAEALHPHRPAAVLTPVASRITLPTNAESAMRDARARCRLRRPGADHPLSEELGDDVDVVLIDKADGFVFGFSKLDVMFGRTTPEAVQPSLPRPGQARCAVRADDDPRRSTRQARRVETDAGAFEADVLVVALGADLHPAATPGLVEGGHEFYTVAGAFAAARRARRLRRRTGRRRGHLDAVQVPARAERDRAAAARLPRPARAARRQRDLAGHAAAACRSRRRPAASEALLAAFAERGIAWHPGAAGARPSTRSARVAVLADGDEMPFDLFLGVPVHRAPAGRPRTPGCASTAGSRSTRSPWRRAFPDVYAVGDVTSVGTPKAGVFAEGQARWSPTRSSPGIARSRRDVHATTVAASATSSSAHDQVARVEVTFRSGERRTGSSTTPSELLAADKAEFGTSRIRRWFGRDWTAY